MCQIHYIFHYFSLLHLASKVITFWITEYIIFCVKVITSWVTITFRVHCYILCGNIHPLLLIKRLSFTNGGFRKEFSGYTTSSRGMAPFFSHGEFTHKYDLKFNFLQYLQVVSAIPLRLVEEAKRNLDAKFTF